MEHAAPNHSLTPRWNWSDVPGNRELHRMLAVYPLMILLVIGAIHWEALKLWVKGVPVFTHPCKIDAHGSHATVEESCRPVPAVQKGD
jgi:DUF1365 family protein